MYGSNPSTLIEPSALRCVSFFAYAESCASVFGGALSPAFLNNVLL
jgi:hypothetical protein